jgi:hypothetical protein
MKNMKKILLSGTLGACSIAFAAERSEGISKEFHLHFDVNKTIIALDAVQGKGLNDTVNAILAEFTYEKWNGEQHESYYSYITNKLAGANPSVSPTDKTFKDRRMHLLKKFPSYLENYPTLRAQYEREKAAMLAILNTQEMVIFPSFFKLIAWLNTHCPQRYALYLRTFGKDLDRVVPLIESKSKLEFAGMGEFKGTVLCIGSQNKQELFYEFFKNPSLKHYAIRDDYAYWESHKFQVSGGKPFPIDLNNHQVISMMFDDNANDPDKPIIKPLGPRLALEDTQQLLQRGNIVAVNPKEAILDEDYFIKKVEALYLESPKSEALFKVPYPRLDKRKK